MGQQKVNKLLRSECGAAANNYLTDDRMIRSAEHVTRAWRYEHIEKASHWPQLDQPEQITKLQSTSSLQASHPTHADEIRRCSFGQDC